MTTRKAAAEIVADVAARLGDPERVREQYEERLARTPAVGDVAGWSNPSLSDGHAGVALLFSELRWAEPRYRLVVHELLRRAVARPVGDAALINGLAAVAFASSRSAEHGDHVSLTAKLDELLISKVRNWGAERSAHTWYHYDVISGLAGIGRYLLSRPTADPLVLRMIADSLAALASPVAVGDLEVPGWWVQHDLEGNANTDHAKGHANIGLAHGVPGCLVTLSLLVRAGYGDEHHEQAVRSMATWILDARREDAHGVYWPTHLLLADISGESGHPPRPSRAAWCYGTPGIARALQIAGLATGEPAWGAAAVDAVRDLARRPESEWGVADASLCHGWAGLLQTFATLHRSAPDPVLGDLIEVAARRTVAEFDPTSLFGFRVAVPGLPRFDRPGFLEGSAGTALALHSYATGAPPRTSWDQVLLLN
ncbi:lanthionine synthetase C family protein [Microtetraspora malaysiensis]|uniref:lanthionine synthetase C family protein n=1 Tax=Microtetraspora malaysiensis TaxID=161358 RepID=UPI003D90940A